MDDQFSFHSLSDDDSENRALSHQSRSTRRGQFAVPISNFVSTINTPAGQLQPFTQPDGGFTPQIQPPTVPTSVPMYDSTWGTSISLQTHFSPAYHQYTIPSTSPPLLGNEWALTDYNAASQMVSQPVIGNHELTATFPQQRSNIPFPSIQSTYAPALGQPQVPAGLYVTPNTPSEATYAQSQFLSPEWESHSDFDYFGEYSSEATTSIANQEVFACTIGDCTKEYTCMRSLVRHQRIVHIGAPELECPNPGCNWTTPYRSSLQRHVGTRACGRH